MPGRSVEKRGGGTGRCVWGGSARGLREEQRRSERKGRITGGKGQEGGICFQNLQFLLEVKTFQSGGKCRGWRFEDPYAWESWRGRKNRSRVETAIFASRFGGRGG